MTKDGATGDCGNDVVCDRDGEWRDVEADGVVNPKATERSASRTGNKLRHEIANRVGQQREDDAPDNVPTADIQVGEPSFKEGQDKLADHQNEGEDDESVHYQRELSPFERLAEASGDKYPAGKHHRKIPDPDKKPSEKYALRMVVAKPAPGKPSVASQKFGKGELCGNQNAEQDRAHQGHE